MLSIVSPDLREIFSSLRPLPYLPLVGIVGPILIKRSHLLKRSLSYALSASTSSGLCFRLPLLWQDAYIVSIIPMVSLTSWRISESA